MVRSKVAKEPEIVVKNLAKTFDTKNVLHNVNFEVRTGESLTIIGGSGSGKSVLIKCIMGLLVPDKGSSVIIQGNEYAEISISERFKNSLDIGMLFQGNALFDSLTICENITFGIRSKKEIDKEEAREIAKQKLEMVELSANILDLYPVEISGGMQKRVALARAIAHNPTLIFFDEPTTGLDPVTAKKISILIREISKKLNATTIAITHDVRCMNIISDSVAVIAEGTIIWHSKLADLAKTNHPYIQEFILLK